MTCCHRVSLLIVLAAVALAAIAPPEAAATLARVRGLGDGAAYLEDDANVLTWFASLVDHPDRVVLDLGHLDHDRAGSLNRTLSGGGGGLHAQLDRAGHWGTLGLYVQETLPAGAPGGAITLLGARRFGKLAVGGKAMFSSHYEGSNATEIYGEGEGLYFHAFGLSTRWSVRPGLTGDIAAEIVNVQGDAGRQDLWYLPYQQAWTTWGARTRWFLALSEVATLVPAFDHRQDDRQALAALLDAPADRHARRTAAGLGMNLQPAGHDQQPFGQTLVVISGELSWGRERNTRLPDSGFIYEYDRSDATYREVHARVGLETMVQPWLTIRGALQYYRLQNEVDAARGLTDEGRPVRWLEERRIQVLTPITLGVSLHAGPFQADLVLNARWTETYGTFPFGPVASARGTYTGVVLGYRF